LCLPVCLSQAAARPACSRLGQCKLVSLVTGIVANLQRRSEALKALVKETSEELETLQKGSQWEMKWSCKCRIKSSRDTSNHVKRTGENSAKCEPHKKTLGCNWSRHCHI
jgi:predicted dithiol-disulfide oxidoreductase (DUF899 family)